MKVTLGDLELHVPRTGRFRLDGGAMFGVVPRPLWTRIAPPDDRNRIGLGLNCVLVRGLPIEVVVDTGIGSKWDAKGREMYAIEDDPGIARAVEAASGLTPDRIQLVVNTHLHFDHAGGNTYRAADGSIRRTFPEAFYAVQRGNLFEEALSPHELRRASYLPENFVPIQEASRFRLLEGDQEIVPGIRGIVTGGHQKFHMAVLLESRGERAIFLGDIVPTAAHVNPTWIMAYDHYPLDTLRAKKDLLARAAEEGWVVILEHEPHEPVGRVARDGAKYRWEPLQGAAAA